MINFANVTFVKSCPTRKEKPQDKKPEVLIVGKSNVGKSSLINALCQKKKMAFTSSKPGHTRLLNYYVIKVRFHHLAKQTVQINAAFCIAISRSVH